MKLTYLLVLLTCIFALNVSAQAQKNTFEVYGFVMTDAGYNVKTVNPDWYDALRATKLNSYAKEFAPDGKVFFSARQSRLGVKSSIATDYGEFKTKFEFDMFGVGSNVGQTDIRLRHAWGELGALGAGQTNSTFMDGDVFPNSLEYWGPCGMLFFRNIQIRYTPLNDKSNNLAFALENPGASGDQGIYAGRSELSGVRSIFNVPDLTAHYRYTGDFGYVQFGGIVGSMKWTNIADSAYYNFNGGAVRWGTTLSSNINLGKKAVLRLQGVYGEGVENYFNDAPVDVGIDTTSTGDPRVPFKGVAIPAWGATAFIDINWSKMLSSSIGYSVTTIVNTNGQSANAFKQGQYMLVNLLCYPVNNVMAGIEVLYARRDNFKDGFHSDNTQVRFAFKYNFSHVVNF